jgi:hypothetical protein
MGSVCSRCDVSKMDPAETPPLGGVILPRMKAEATRSQVSHGRVRRDLGVIQFPELGYS